MKVQCSCGAKYIFEITPEMRTNPVRFVCPACGVDASQFVDSLVRRELGQSATPAGIPVSVLGAGGAPAAAPVGVLLDDSPPAPAPAAPAARPAVSVRRAVAVQAPPAEEGGEGQPIEGKPCLKHPGEIATEKCFICSKPICPKCMELFGYVCSPLCKAKADSHGIQVPVYALQKSVVEARQWRKVVMVSGSAGVVVAALLGVWFWYAWFGCVPHPVFSVKFPQRSYSGQSILCGKDNDQIVFLHGDLLARYEMKSTTPVWEVHLLDAKKFETLADKEIEQMQKDNIRARDHGAVDLLRIPPKDKLVEEMMRSAEEEMSLYVRGQNIWVGQPGTLDRFDWNTGKQDKQLTVQSRFGGVIARGDELMLVDSELGKPMVTRINLQTSEMTTEDITAPEAKMLASAGGTGQPAAARPGGSKTTGLPTQPGKDINKPLDPAKVAEQASHMSLPERIALPATLSGVMTQNKTLKAMDDDQSGGDGDGGGGPGSSFSLIPAKDGGFVEFSSKLLEHRIEQRVAMKAAPKKSALEGNVSAGNSLEVANEMLNEMQRERGGDTVEEDVSRYQVTIRRPDTRETWTGEVVGPPKVFPLDTLNVVTANKLVMVFDKHNKKLWQSSLNYDVVRGLGALDEESATYGQGPCVQHKGILYVFDQGVLTAFDQATGNVHWRLPSVGIAGIFFDDADNIYVNTTTASPDTIKYSKQIDISDKVSSVVQKVDAKSGKVLWTVQPGGLVNHVYGKIILVAQSYRPLGDDPDDGPTAGFSTPAHLRIRRINARNGEEVWEYFQQRAPLDIGFDKNIIRLVFRKEVQVLKFTTF